MRMKLKELRKRRKKHRMHHLLDTRQVNLGVLGPWVVAVDEERTQCKYRQNNDAL